MVHQISLVENHQESATQLRLLSPPCTARVRAAFHDIPAHAGSAGCITLTRVCSLWVPLMDYVLAGILLSQRMIH